MNEETSYIPLDLCHQLCAVVPMVCTLSRTSTRVQRRGLRIGPSLIPCKQPLTVLYAELPVGAIAFETWCSGRTRDCVSTCMLG